MKYTLNCSHNCEWNGAVVNCINPIDWQGVCPSCQYEREVNRL